MPELALRAGADKVSMNSAAVGAVRPAVLTEAADRVSESQCVVASIDAQQDRSTASGWRVVVHGGRTPTDRDALEWAAECVERGAGEEILLTSIDRDGSRSGYDLALTRAVVDRVSVPVICASGGSRKRSRCVRGLE